MDSRFQVTKKEIEKGREGGRKKEEEGRERERKGERKEGTIQTYPGKVGRTLTLKTEPPRDSASFKRQGGIQGLSHGNRLSLLVLL